MSARFSDLVTLLAALATGLALFAIAARGLHAGALHLRAGDLQSAILATAIATASLLLSLAFLMPGVARRILTSAQRPTRRILLRSAALALLLGLALACVLTFKASGPRILGVVPRTWLLPGFAGFALLYTLAFILPGLAYPAKPNFTDQTRDAIESQPEPSGRAFPMVDQAAFAARWPRLRRLFLTLLYLCFSAYGGLTLGFTYANVIPSAQIADIGWRFLVPVTLALSLPLSLLIAVAPTRPGSSAASRFWFKAAAIVVFGGLNAFATVELPRRVLPVVAVYLQEAKMQAQSYQVVSTSPRSRSSDECGNALTVRLAPESESTFKACRIPSDIFATVGAGDTVTFTGRVSTFGMVWEHVRRE